MENLENKGAQEGKLTKEIESKTAQIPSKKVCQCVGIILLMILFI